MNFLFTSRANARAPYSRHAAQARVGVPRCARNDWWVAIVETVTILAALLVLFVSTSAFAASTITGKVANGTSGKPAAGDEVILLKLAEGMQEQARTKTDAQGRFQFSVDASDVPHLIRVIHQKVNYHRPAPPGTTSVDVQVFDAASKLEGISATVDLMRMQAQSGSLQVTELFALKNNSEPPRTLMGDRTFQISLPEDSQIDSAVAAGPGGMPVNSAPASLGKGQYAFVFPLRPGETRFQVNYHLPYSGEAEFKPRLAYKAETFAIMLPKSMQFTAAVPGTFNLADEQDGTVVQIAKNVGPGAVAGFRVKGTGTIPEATASGEATSTAGAPDSRPGGGLGKPSELPDPLRPYRWYILGGLAGVLALGAVWFLNRQPQTAVAGARAFSSSQQPPSTAGRRSPLLDALKEELFQLESERLQQKISPAEYEKAKAALEHTLQRALRRNEQHFD
jgi:hypothetical protein